MALTTKVLGQSAPVAATLSILYTVSALKSAIGASIVVCNRSATPTSFRVSVAIAAAVDTVAQYIYYDVAIGGNDTFIATIGMTLEATDVVRVYATLATLSFTLFGTERT